MRAAELEAKEREREREREKVATRKQQGGSGRLRRLQPSDDGRRAKSVDPNNAISLDHEHQVQPLLSQVKTNVYNL